MPVSYPLIASPLKLFQSLLPIFEIIIDVKISPDSSERTETIFKARARARDDRANKSKTAIGKYKPQDATTNPSLILAASKKAEYAKLTDAAIDYAKKQGGDVDSQVEHALDRLLVEFGKEILKIIPGKVSTEVDAAFSFDTKKSVEKALHIIKVRLSALDHPLLLSIAND